MTNKTDSDPLLLFQPEGSPGLPAPRRSVSTSVTPDASLSEFAQEPTFRSRVVTRGRKSLLRVKRWTHLPLSRVSRLSPAIRRLAVRTNSAGRTVMVRLAEASAGHIPVMKASAGKTLHHVVLVIDGWRNRLSVTMAAAATTAVTAAVTTAAKSHSHARTRAIVAAAFGSGVAVGAAMMSVVQPAAQDAAAAAPIIQRLSDVTAEAQQPTQSSPPQPLQSQPPQAQPPQAQPGEPQRPTGRPVMAQRTAINVATISTPSRNRMEAPRLPTSAGTSAGARTQFYGALRVHSEPSGASVFANGRKMGVTPISLPKHPTGSIALKLTRDGYAAWSTAIRVVANQPTFVSAKLRRED